MSQRFLFDEDHQLPAKIIRAVIWSALMGVLWAAPFAVLTMLLLIVGCLMIPLAYIGYDGWMLAVVIFASATLWAVIAGAMTGAGAALDAPNDEPFWPLQAGVFRHFGRRMVPLAVLMLMVVIPLMLLDLFWFAIVPLIAGFGCGIWREVALHRKKAA